MLSWIRDAMTPGGRRRKRGAARTATTAAPYIPHDTSTGPPPITTTTTTSVGVENESSSSSNTTTWNTTSPFQKSTTTNPSTTTAISTKGSLVVVSSRKTRSDTTTAAALAAAKNNHKTERAASNNDNNNTNNNNTTTNNTNNKNISIVSIPELWQTLDRQLRVNIGTSVKCGICLSTMSRPVRTPCVHSFCHDCILASLHVRKACPECNTPLTSKRCLQPFHYLDEMASAYKDLLVAFGFTPGTYHDTFTTLTQKVVLSSDKEDDNDDQDHSPQARFDRWCVAKTWQQKALPQLPQVSELQRIENDQVVQANREACEDGMDLYEYLENATTTTTTTTKEEDDVEDEELDADKKPKATNRRKVMTSPSVTAATAVVPPPLSLPGTQEVQEQAREQLAADQELHDSMDMLEGSEQPQNEEGHKEETALSQSQVYATATQTSAAMSSMGSTAPQDDHHHVPLIKEKTGYRVSFGTTSPTTKSNAAPSPPMFAQSNNTKRRSTGRKSYGTRDRDSLGTNMDHRNVVPAAAASASTAAAANGEDSDATLSPPDYIVPVVSTATSATVKKDQDPFESDTISPIGFRSSQVEPSFFMDTHGGDNDNDNKDESLANLECAVPQPETVTTAKAKNRVSSSKRGRSLAGNNVTGMLEDSRGGLHMYHDSVLYPEADKYGNNNRDVGADKKKTDDVVERLGENNNQNDTPIGDENQNGDPETAGQVDDDDLTQPMPTDSEEADEIKVIAKTTPAARLESAFDQRNITVTTLESHTSTKEAITDAATLPAGNERIQSKQSKKQLFGDQNEIMASLKKKNTTIPIPGTEEMESDSASSNDMDTKPAASSIGPRNRLSLKEDDWSEDSSDEENGRNHVSHKNQAESLIQSSEYSTREGRKSCTTANPSSNIFPVGTIVNVVARTWPGVNKQGGVGRITAVNTDGTFNVAYVLGGKESNVDETFIARANELADDEQDPVTSRRRRRPQDELPEDLLRQLAEEGFDTGTVAASAASSSRRGKKRKESPVNALVDSTNSNARKSTGRKKSSKTTVVAATTATSKGKRKQAHDTTADDGMEVKSTAFAKKTKSHNDSTKRGPKSAGISGNGKKRAREATNQGTAESPTKITPVVHTTTGNSSSTKSSTVRGTETWNCSNEEAAKLADEHYAQRFQSAREEKLITVAASNLNDDEMTLLKSLCATTFPGDVKMRTTEAIGRKTTICVISADCRGGGGGENDIQANIRSLKAMRSALEGVPMTTPNWLRACGKEGKILNPTTFVRTLPTKSKEIEESGEARYGVARLSAILKSVTKRPSSLPFRNHFAFFCGSYPQKMKSSLSQLWKDGGGKVLPNPADVSARLHAITKPGSAYAKVLIVCGDSGVSLPKSLEGDLKALLEGEYSPKIAAVVNSQWIMESVTCAKALPATFFEPSAKKELWRLSLD